MLEVVEKDLDIRARSSQPATFEVGILESDVPRYSSSKENLPRIFVSQELYPISRFFPSAAPMFGLWSGKSLLDFQGRKNKLSLLETN